MGDWVPVEKGRGILFEKQSLGYGQVVVRFFSPNMYFFLTQMILGRKLTGKTMKFLLFIFVGVVHLLPLASGKAIHGNGTSQRTFQEIKEEIAHYGDVAKAIINFTVYGKGQNRSYERLALLVDTVGPRLSGSKSLEKAIEIMQQNLQGDGLENVHLEPVKIPHWERGEESAVMLEPRIHKMAILGLGSNIGTPPEGMICFFKSVCCFPYKTNAM